MMVFSVLIGLTLLIAPIVLSLVAMSRVSDINRKVSLRLTRLEERLQALETTLTLEVETLRQQRPRSEESGAPDAAEPPEADVASPMAAGRTPDEAVSEEPEQPPTEPEPEATEEPAEIERDADFEDAEARPREPAADEGAGAAQAGLAASVEEKMGGKWSVWAGGVALALGAIFLVKYTIDQGYLTPAIRVVLGAILSLLLAAAGETLRRRSETPRLVGFADADIPAVLTAAAIIAGFATAYAAYALYGFVDPLIAFILLAAVSLAGLAGSVLHGPGLAALGLVGSFLTPALVSTDKPNAWTLFIYLLFVTAATYATARARGWIVLALGAAGLAWLWGGFWLNAVWRSSDGLPVALYIAGLLLLALILLRDETIGQHVEAKPERPWLGLDTVTTTVLVTTSILVWSLARFDHYSPIALTLLIGTVVLFIGSAWQLRNLALLAPWAGVLFLLAYTTWHIPYLTDWRIGELDRQLDLAPVAQPGLAEFLTFGTLFGAGFAIAGYLGALRREGSLAWVITGAVIPLATFLCAYLRATHFEHSVPFGLTGLGIAGLATVAADHLVRTRQGRTWEIASGVYAVTAVAALALALTILLEKGWLTVALALMTPGLAWIANLRSMPFLRYLAVVLAAVVLGRVIYDPLIVGRALGTKPIFNWLLYGYGVPALAFAWSARHLRKVSDDICVKVLEAAAIVFVVLLVTFQVRHLLNDGNVYSAHSDLTELAVHTMSWLALSLGLQRLAGAERRLVPDFAAMLLGAAGFTAMLIGHLIVANPIFTGESIGTGTFFNT
ncbi:MAG: DUF2339 domain-containing protein, partial [Hyphomicrobiaceae bacterium]